MRLMVGVLKQHDVSVLERAFGLCHNSMTEKKKGNQPHGEGITGHREIQGPVSLFLELTLVITNLSLPSSTLMLCRERTPNVTTFHQACPSDSVTVLGTKLPVYETLGETFKSYPNHSTKYSQEFQFLYSLVSKQLSTIWIWHNTHTHYIQQLQGHLCAQNNWANFAI